MKVASYIVIASVSASGRIFFLNFVAYILHYICCDLKRLSVAPWAAASTPSAGNLHLLVFNILKNYQIDTESYTVCLMSLKYL